MKDLLITYKSPYTYRSHFTARVDTSNNVEVPNVTRRLLNIKPGDIVQLTIYKDPND